MLFADLAGYTALSRELDAEEVHALLERFFDLRRPPVVDEHGGRVDKHIGDCVMAVFGAPVAHGNDAERAVRAALAIRDAMPELSARGSAAGCAFTSASPAARSSPAAPAASRHREYTVTGDSVNLASRLTDAAPPGEILISDAVRRPLADRLDCDEAGALAVKGFADPVRAWRLRGRMPRRRPRPADRSSVATSSSASSGRRSPPAARAGAARPCYVRGEAGIGKTRLIEEFQDAARQGRASPAMPGLVLDFGAGTGRDAIRTLVREPARPRPSRAMPRLSQSRGRAAPGRGLGRRTRTPCSSTTCSTCRSRSSCARSTTPWTTPAATRASGATVARLVERASAGAPRLLVVEDVHWADRLTLAHLAQLAATVRAVPRRPGHDLADRGRPARPGVARRGRRRPAPDDRPRPARAERGAGAGRSHSSTRTPRSPSAASSAPLATRSSSSSSCATPRRAARRRVPGSVQSLVQARIDRLDPADKAALQAASVLGQRFAPASSAPYCSTGPTTLPTASWRTCWCGRRATAFLFAHALIRDAVYDTLLRSRRRELHRRAADWFDERDPVLHAEHLDRAEDPTRRAPTSRPARSQPASTATRRRCGWSSAA